MTSVCTICAPVAFCKEHVPTPLDLIKIDAETTEKGGDGNMWSKETNVWL